MKIEVKGKQYSGFLAMTAKTTIDTLCNSFSLQSGPGVNAKLPFSIDDECVIYVDGEPIITGFIEIITGYGDVDSAVLNAIGRDKTCDLLDSSIGTLSDIKPPMSLKRVVELVIQHIGADIDVQDMAGAFFEQGEDLLAPEPGDNAFEFLEKAARKKSVILSSNSEGNVVLYSANAKTIRAGIINKPSDPGHNVLTYNFEYNKTERFNRYETVGNMNVNLLQLLGKIQPSKVVDQRGHVTDKAVREGRQFVIARENSGGTTTMGNRATWESDFRRARSRKYNAVVSGYRNQAGDIWTPNTIIKVVDERANIDDYMLINSVTFRFDQDGRKSEVELINKDAYKLKISEPQETKVGIAPIEDAYAG